MVWLFWACFSGCFGAVGAGGFVPRMCLRCVFGRRFISWRCFRGRALISLGASPGPRKKSIPRGRGIHHPSNHTTTSTIPIIRRMDWLLLLWCWIALLVMLHCGGYVYNWWESDVGAGLNKSMLVFAASKKSIAQHRRTTIPRLDYILDHTLD